MSTIFCYDTGEKVIGYSNYLKTKHWIMLKDKFKKTQVKECVMCGENKNLNIHHMTYERIGNENFDDLVYLCKECHNNLHDKLGDSKSQFLDILKTQKVKPKKTKPLKSCNTCLDFFKGMCLLGFKNKNHNCKHHKRIKVKGRLINDEYTKGSKELKHKQPKNPKTTK